VGQPEPGFENLSYMGIMKLGLMTNQQQSFCPPQGNGQVQSYCTNILSNFVNGNLHVQIVIRDTKLSVIDAFHRERE
jgi:hypothetical protein